MDYKDLAALITIRNYAVKAIEDSYLFKNNDEYVAMDKKILELNNFINYAVLNLDINKQAVTLEKKVTIKHNEESSKQKQLDLFENKTAKSQAKKVVKKTSVKEIETSNDDAKLIAETIAKEKAKLTE